MKIIAKKVAPKKVKKDTTNTFPVRIDKDTPFIQTLKDSHNSFVSSYPILFNEIGEHSLQELHSGVEVELSDKASQEFRLANAQAQFSTPKKKIKFKKKSTNTKWWSEEAKFSGYSKTTYEQMNVMDIEPMLAKEYLNESQLDEMCDSTEYYAEEKLDGVRCTMHFRPEGVRTFSRNIVKKTNWRKEFSDSVPHLRDMQIPELEGTIIDGEMFIPNKTFKEVSSTLNCLLEEAIERQKTEGFIVLNAFDILFYKDEDVRDEPLERRKQYLAEVVELIQSKYGENTVKLVPYFDRTTKVLVPDYLVRLYLNDGISKEAYPNFTSRLDRCDNLELGHNDFSVYLDLNKKEFFEFIVLTGGEGIILKSKKETYKHKRGREYTKWKKFITRDCILIAFSAPTKEYEGKSLDEGKTWGYWVDSKDNIYERELTREQANKLGYVAVTKHYAKKWVGNMKFGVIITPQDKEALAKTSKGREVLKDIWKIQNYEVLEVGECTGMTEEDRIMFSEDRLKYRTGTVVEILANDMFKDTGKLRHPRFLRIREDKNIESCTWENHVN